jgi:hypothetical protein
VGVAVAVIGLTQFFLGTNLFCDISLSTDSSFIGGSVMSERKKIFKGDAFLKKQEVVKLQEEHKKAFGTLINDMGYPDMGNGRYSDLIPYDSWVHINNAQRAHYNMIESSGPVLAAVVVGGLFYPVVCAALGVAYALGRLAYGIGYRSNKGADGRLVGAIVSFFATFGLYGVNIYSGLKAAGISFGQ